MNDRITVYRDPSGDYRWRRQAGNNEVIAASSEGYGNLQDAYDNIDRTQAEPYVIELDGGDVATAVVGDEALAVQLPGETDPEA